MIEAVFYKIESDEMVVREWERWIFNMAMSLWPLTGGINTIDGEPAILLGEL